MPTVMLEHFVRAAGDIAAHGDNDMLPFDIDTRFIADNKDVLARIAFDFYTQLGRDSIENTKNRINRIGVFSERLLAPAGHTGFRAATKIQPFWNLYLNGLGVATAAALEHEREAGAWSYRFLQDGEDELFDRNSSWREFRESTAREAENAPEGSVVIQTDISSFYEHVSHHYIENHLSDLFRDGGRVGKQVVGLLTKFSGGRSFGLPVGGQAARALAELVLHPIDRELTVQGLNWARYVDDYVLVTPSSEAAYSALSKLSHVLGDYGLSLSRNKTSILSAKHYQDYVSAQLGGEDEEALKLKEIDLHYDPYSDTAVDEYDSLRETVESLEVQKLLNRELEKSLPDTFLVTQIGRTLRLQSPEVALQLITTLLGRGNLHAFRASWASVMRGVSALRGHEDFTEIADRIDVLLDRIPTHSSHLLQVEASVLHYLRTLRFSRTPSRAAYVRSLYDSTRSETVKRACIDCWRKWVDRPVFTMLRGRWNTLSSESQRMIWLAAGALGDEGEALQRQFKPSTDQAWALGVERQNVATFANSYRNWCGDVQDTL